MKFKKVILVIFKISYLVLLAKMPSYVKGLSPLGQYVLVYKSCQKDSFIKLTPGTYTETDRLKNLGLASNQLKKVEFIIPNRWHVTLYNHDFVTEEHLVEEAKSARCFTLSEKIKSWKIEEN